MKKGDIVMYIGENVSFKQLVGVYIGPHQTYTASEVYFPYHHDKELMGANKNGVWTSNLKGVE